MNLVSDLCALPVAVRKRIVSKVRFFSLNNPLKFAKKLAHNDLGEFRFRVGGYRTVFDAVKNQKEIVILKIPRETKCIGKIKGRRGLKAVNKLLAGSKSCPGRHV